MSKALNSGWIVLIVLIVATGFTVAADLRVPDGYGTIQAAVSALHPR